MLIKSYSEIKTLTNSISRFCDGVVASDSSYRKILAEISFNGESIYKDTFERSNGCFNPATTAKLFIRSLFYVFGTVSDEDGFDAVSFSGKIYSKDNSASSLEFSINKEIIDAFISELRKIHSYL